MIHENFDEMKDKILRFFKTIKLVFNESFHQNFHESWFCI